LAIWLLAGCAAPRDPLPMAAYTGDVPLEQILRGAAEPWIGTPHRLGGMSRRGVDCSGLAVALYLDLLGVPLPRTTKAQMRVGRPVAKDQWMAGDLVFFKPAFKYRHVGIYLGRGEFVHASASSGVMISRMDDDYWRRCYRTSRRVLKPR
jgi:probable lipoprotein NlpC